MYTEMKNFLQSWPKIHSHLMMGDPSFAWRPSLKIHPGAEIQTADARWGGIKIWGHSWVDLGCMAFNFLSIWVWFSWHSMAICIWVPGWIFNDIWVSEIILNIFRKHVGPKANLRPYLWRPLVSLVVLALLVTMDETVTPNNMRRTTQIVCCL